MSTSKTLSCSSPKLSPPVTAVLDLAVPQERATLELLRRFCTGRWPLWRLLGLRREGNMLCAAVEWRRSGRSERYSVVGLSLKETAIRWRYVPSAAAARAAVTAFSSERQIYEGAAA